MVKVRSALAEDLISVASIHISQLQPPLPALENSFTEHMYSRTISPICLTQKSNTTNLLKYVEVAEEAAHLSMSYSCKGPEFNSQHPHGGS